MTSRSAAPISAPAVLVAVFIIAICGLIYELLAGTLASYVLGDSVTQFSTVIGVYLFAMGIGSWVSRYVVGDIVARFIEIEIAVAVVGGTSAAVLFLSFSRLKFFSLILYGEVGLVGLLVGLEIPLLMRILQDQYDLKELVSRVLTVDYLGALVASLAFPLFIVPKLGLVRGGFAVGLLNAVVAVWCTYLLQHAVKNSRRVLFLRIEAFFALALMVAGIFGSEWLTRLAEDTMYKDPIVFAETTPYQRIVVTQGRGGFSLFLNGALQLNSQDEHRYHEALVHPAMAVARTLRGEGARRVLVLGGGDGLAVREIFEHPGVEAVTLVDLDPAMTKLGSTFVPLVEQNRGALLDPRVTVVNQDAMRWLSERQSTGRFDVVIVDFPDPSSFSLGKLYTTRFYGMVRQVMTPDAALVVQSTSPMYARRSFWTVARTLEEVSLQIRGYHTTVPSFGEWGYVLAAGRAFDIPDWLPNPQDFLTPQSMGAAFVFAADTSRVDVQPNRLDNQVLVRIYEREWAQWN